MCTGTYHDDDDDDGDGAGDGVGKVACRKGATDDDACVYTARAGGSGGASYHTTYDDDATYDDDDGTEASDFCVDSAWRGVGRGLKSWTVVGSGSVETRARKARRSRRVGGVVLFVNTRER